MTLYVGNLSFEATEDDLFSTFKEYGSVTKVNLILNRGTGSVRGFAFVEMEKDAEETSAIEALDGALWMGRNIKVDKARPRQS